MFKYFIITISIILLAGLILPQICLAGNIPFEGPLVPCGTEEHPEKCGLCHLFKLIQNIIDLFLTLIIFIAPLMIVIGGIVILTAGGVPERVATGKRIITYVVIGIVISFTAWILINTSMITLVGEGAGEGEQEFPWPWNEIDCEGTSAPPGETHMGCIDQECKEVSGAGEDECSTDEDCIQEGSICRCEWDSGTVTTKTYSDSEECDSACESYCSTPGGPPSFLSNYCCVEDSQEECVGDGFGNEEVWCVCEIPVYTVDSNLYPSKTEVRGTEFKGTEFSSENECSQGCNSGNAGSYCPQRSVTDEASEGNFYCTSQNSLETKTAHCVKEENISSDVNFLKSFSTQQDCINSVLPDNEDYEKDCAEFCWVDGNLYCDCADRSPVWTLYQIQKESQVVIEGNAWACINTCGNSCRLGSFQEPTGCTGEEEEDQWCQRDAPAGSEYWVLNPPPGGAMEEQKGDASAQLASFINCMYGKLSNLEINSISSNALCDDPSCDTTQSGVCGHTANSCHFGGTNCDGESYAVDFNTNVSCADIKEAALECDSTAWVNWEDDHTHVSVNGTACGCPESGSGEPCP